MNDNNWRNSKYHKLFGLKAGQMAQKTLKIFEKERPNDDRPKKAITANIDWAEGKRKLEMKEVRKLSLDAHAAARECKTLPAKYATRAAGQAIATWHVPTHALAVPMYTTKAKYTKNEN